MSKRDVGNLTGLGKPVRFCWLAISLIAVLAACRADDAPATAVFDAAPVLVWQKTMAGAPGTPVVVPGTDGEQVVIATETAVIALDTLTGQENWRVTPPDGVYPRSLVGGETAVYVGAPGGLLALRTRDGQTLWQTPIRGEVLWPPLLDGDALYVGTAFVGPGILPNPAGRAWLYALEAATGQPRWGVETAAYTLTTPAAAGDLVVSGGSLLSDADVEEGGMLRLHAFDRRSGALRWTADSPDGLLKSLAVDERHVYFLAYTDMLYALNRDNGAAAWRYPTENWSPGFSYAAGTLYLGSDNGFLHAVDGMAGTAVWQSQLEGIFNAPRARPALAGDWLIFQGNDNRLYGLQRATGAITWRTEPQPRSRMMVVVGNGRLFLVGQDNTLYAYGSP